MVSEKCTIPKASSLLQLRKMIDTMVTMMTMVMMMMLLLLLCLCGAV